MHTIISCTHGDMEIEVDRKGAIIWQDTNADLPGAPLKDACGAQLLPNGDLVVTSYGSGGADGEAHGGDAKQADSVAVVQAGRMAFTSFRFLNPTVVCPGILRNGDLPLPVLYA